MRFDNLGALVLAVACAVPATAYADEPELIRFNFKGASFDQVLDYFSRVTGLPVVREADVPEGTLDYLAPEQYTLDEALVVLNILLQSKGVALRVSDEMLYLQKLTEMQRENIPVFIGQVPSSVSPHEIVTVVRPLEIAMAKPLAEQLAAMVAEYGSVAAMEQQNSLVITETAGQIRRLLTIVDELDREDPEGAVEFFTLRYAKAKELMEPLEALLSHRIEKWVTDQKGKQVKTEETSMPGLSISADERTNSIIAKGVQSRIDKLREAIALLDVPAIGAGRTVRTFALARLAPEAATAKLTQLYAKLPEEQRPTIIALDDLAKITLIGSTGSIDEAAALLAEIDGPPITTTGATQRAITVIALDHADPAAVAAALRSLLNGRQLVTTKMVPGPDRRSLIIAGPVADVEAVQALVPVLDQPPHLDRTVRLYRLTAADTAAVLERSRELYLSQVDAGDPTWALALNLDASGRQLTAIGSVAAQQRFAEVLRMVQDNTVIERETRQVHVTSAEPSTLVAPVLVLARQLLQPHDGSRYDPPTIEAVDPLDLLVITARPEQFGVIERLVATLDRPVPGDFQFRVITLSGIDATALMKKAGFVYERLNRGLDPDERPVPSVDFDPLTGNLLISGTVESVRAYETAVAEARKLLPPARTGRIIELHSARVTDVIEPLRTLLATTAAVDPSRAVPDPSIEVLERTNSLYVLAEPVQHQVIERAVRILDRFEPTELPPLQLIQVRAADAMQISSMLRRRYEARPAEQRREMPVTIDADAGTNTLIVTAHTEIYDEVKQFVDSINRSGEAERETMLFSLNRARAVDLAVALDRLYPQPPMPLDRRGRPLPHLQEPKEVHVSADAATNTLIVEAPSERRAQFEALVEQLDRVQLPPRAQLRTYHIERGDPAQIARTLMGLARQGVLSELPEDGGKPVEVTILAEPVSRTLIVAGDDVTFEKIEQMLHDLQAVPIRRSLRVFDVTGTEPRQMADQALRLYEEQTAEVPDALPVSVEVDADNSTLLVVADDEAMLRFMAILNELQDSIAPPPDVQLIALENQTAEATVEFLEDLASSALGMLRGRGGPPPVFVAIQRTNSVLIGAQRDQQAIIRSLVASFDEPEPQDMPPLRILQLRTADADNLARALMRQYDRRPPEERRDRPVTIYSDSQTNALIVAAHPDMLPDIQMLVEELNTADRFDAEGREIRIFPLRVARAEELARTIDEMFPQPPVPRDRRGRLLYHLQPPREIVVRGDPQTNSLIVDAPIQRMAGFQALVEQLDRQQMTDETQVRTYHVLNADLNAVSATLRQLAADGNLSPSGRDRRVMTSITTEPRSRTLIVSGPADIFDRVEQVLTELDARRVGPVTALRFFTLDNARAETLVPMLQAILVQRIAEDVPDAGPDPAALLHLSADRKSNTLILSAPPSILEVAESLIAQLDHPRSAVDSVDVRIFQLTQAKAPEVARAVTQAVQTRARAEGDTAPVSVAAEPSTNSIIVTAEPAQVERIAAMIAELDGAPPADQHQVRTVFLKYARAERVAPIVSQLLGRDELVDTGRLPSWALMQYAEIQRRRGEPTIRVAADTRLNAVVISAPPSLLAVAEQMVMQLDVDPRDVIASSTRRVRVMTVRNADARELSVNLAAIFDDPSAAEPAPTIRVDAASNSLLILATDEQFAMIEQIVGDLDRATIASSREMRMIPIDPGRASAAELARTLKRMLRTGRGSNVRVISLDELMERRRGRERSGASRETSAGDADDEDGEPGAALPMNLQAAVVATVFAAFQSDDDDDVAGSEITIAIDPATNSLVVVGSPRAVKRVADLAKQLVEQLPAAPGQVHYIGLPEELSALTTSRLIQQTINAMTPPGGRRGDLRRRVAVIADTANNALIVTCNDFDFEVVGDLIAALSQPAMVQQMVVKVYPLETITAQRAAESVRQLLQPDAALRRRGRQAQRMRDLAVTLLAGDTTIEAVFNPDRVKVNVDPQNNALVVMGPPEAIGFIDQFIELLDQTPINVQTTLKLYPLQYAEARDLQNTLRSIFRVRFENMRAQLGQGAIQPEFSADRRTNTLLVTASREQLQEVDALMEQLDRKLGEDRYPLKIIELTAAQPQQAARMLEKVVLGTDQARRASTMIVADDATGTLLVRASEEIMAEIEAVLKEIDRPPTRQFKVRTIVLERADASTVAAALQRLFDDRAQIASAGRGRRARSRQVSIIGDRNSNTLLVAANDEDFDEIEKLVEHFDTRQASQALGFRIFELRHAKAADIARTVQNLANQISLAEEGPWWFFGNQGDRGRSRRGSLAVQADLRLNALIVTGEGDKFEVVEQLIELLDAPEGSGEQRVVKLYPLQHADVNVVADVLTEAFAYSSRNRRWWQAADPTDARIRTDIRNKVIIVYGTRKQQQEIAEFITNIDDQSDRGEQHMAVLPVEFAQARELADTLTRFLRDRDRAVGAPASTTTITASASTNTLIVSAEADDLAMIRDLLTRMDQPDVSGERRIEIIALTDGDAQEIARIVTQQFGRRSGGGGGGAGVIVTPDARTNSLVVNAPRAQFVQAVALIERLDAPSASDETIIRTYALKGARAREVVRILRETLELDSRGETKGISIRLEGGDGPAVEVKAKIVDDRRSNSIIVTATEESFPVIEALIAKIDDVPAASPLEYRIIPLEHALAVDVAFTLRTFLRGRDDGPGGEVEPKIDINRLENQLIIAATSDQFEQIRRIIAELDQPSQNQRITDFVPLRFARAEQVQEALSVFYGPFSFEADTPGKFNARIVADPASNSLVITADQSEWTNIRALLAKLDSEEYDTSLQLKVLPLTYADARSVAGAINGAFSTEISRGRRQTDRGGRPSDADRSRRDERDYPTVLVEAQEWVRAAAEPLTNSVIISASRQNMRKIEQIVTQLDVADYAKLPPPQIIPVRSGSPTKLAEALRRLYEQSGDTRGRRALRIVGDTASNSIIVRAEEEEFRQIRALAEALQSEASEQGLSVYVLKLNAAPVRRVSAAISQAYRAKATQAGQPLAIEVDVAGNTLVVACTAAMFDEIRETVRQLDELSPPAGHGIFIIELENISPDAARKIVETIGLDKPPSDDTVSRLVTEPIRVVPLTGRNAVIVVANPADRETIIGVFKAIDSEPILAESQMRVIMLRNAEAPAMARILQEILNPGSQQSRTPLARAVQEQVRRLAISRVGLGESTVTLDLTKPIRVIADAGLNAIVISSTPGNVEAMAEVVATFDRLPITDAVEVKLFPLSNIAAADFARIVRELFAQGKQLGRVPGSRVSGVPEGHVGKALLDTIALSVDERTNTVIVAGKIDAVALVEVLYLRIDREVSNGWIEPRIVPLRFADAQDLAETLNAILVDGVMDGRQANPMQRQVARLRLARVSNNGGRVLESDVFSPMTRLVIRAEPKINALVLVGTPMNLEVVSELIRMMDIESAAPGASVRIYPLEHASAGRVAATVTRLFAQQEQAGMIRRDDLVIIQADDRTNSLVVSTSRSSFAVVEGLLETLDTAVPPELAALQRLDLVNASATRVAAMVRQLMEARLERLRRTEPETAELQRATIVPDTRTNSLVIAAGRESFEVVRALVEDLDRAAIDEDALISVIPVSRGNVERIAETVKLIMERRYADMPPELRRSQQPLVLTDPRSNSLMVAAGPDDLAAITQLVRKLEATPSNPAIRLAVIPLESSAADRLAPRIQSLMRQRQQSLGTAAQPSDRVSVEPDTATNSLIVAASDENLQVIHDLIDALTGGLAGRNPGSEVEIVQLVSSTASDVVALLGDLYVDDANRRRGRDTVRVTADERLNAVLISAPVDDVRAIKRLVAQLDGARPAQVVEIRYIPLMSANALETVGLIEDVLSGRGMGTRRASRQAIVLKYFHQYAGSMGNGEPRISEMEVSTAIRESITLTPDFRTNTIIVSAPQAAMAMIERMVRDLDESSVGAQNVRIFKLVNADALAMAEILTDLFNLRRRGNLYVLKPRERQQTDIAPAGAVRDATGGPAGPYSQLLGAELTAVPDDRRDLSITVDNRTNSLLVSGTPLYLDLVAEVVQNLDALEANEREVFAYPLRNAVATEVASVLTQFVDQEQRKLLSTLSPGQLGSASRLLEREVTIVGDEKSNTVLVSASPRYMDRVRQMILELDVDPPQVLIQVLLAEISLTGALEWGVDARFQSNSQGSQNVIFGASSSLASAFLPTLGLPTFSVSGDNFSLLLKALEAQGRIQVLSNPSVMAANNQPARIQIGENIGRASSSSLAGGGTQQTTVEFIDIGVILNVTPSINPDGFVRMLIEPEITDLTNETIQVSEDLAVPILTKRTASTTVTVRDGQTIVIGGLIQDMYELRKSKVPILGDIPLIGWLFRSESEESRKIELLIVLTPHVITSPADYERINQLTRREIDRMSVSPQVKQGLRDGRLIPEKRTWKQRIKADMEARWKRSDDDKITVELRTESEQSQDAEPLTTFEVDQNREAED